MFEEEQARYTIKEGQKVIPLGTWVRIIKDSYTMVEHKGEVAMVVGYESPSRPVTCITQLKLEIPRDCFFQFPSRFPWQVEVIPAPEEYAGYVPGFLRRRAEQQRFERHMGLKPLAANVHLLVLDDVQVLFSYQTPVGYTVKGKNYVSHNYEPSRGEKRSAQTSRHINRYLPDWEIVPDGWVQRAVTVNFYLPGL